VQLQNTNSVQPITTILLNEAQASDDLLGGEGIIEFLESTVSMLFSLSASASPGSAIDLQFPPTESILGSLAILFNAANGVNSNYGTLIDLLESVEDFLRRVAVYVRIPSTAVVDETMFDIVVELLGLTTKSYVGGRNKRPIIILSRCWCRR